MGMAIIPVLVMISLMSGFSRGQSDLYSYNQCSPNLSNFLILDDFEEYAEKYMSKKIFAYVHGGNMLEQTLNENRAGFFRLRLRHKLLRDTKNLDISTTLLGHKVSMPIGISPTALAQIVHPEGENATARAVKAANTIMILSMRSSLSMEEVAAHSPGTMRWAQVNSVRNRKIFEDLLRRARKAGYSAIVYTADIKVTSFRIKAKRANFSFRDYRYGSTDKYNKIYPEKDLDDDRSLTWDDLKWIKSISGLPLVVKGITTAEDAKLAVKHGANAIIVSTHGGRQLDGSPASIEALPEVVAAVRGQAEVYLDSGVRTGSDVVKALALGARAVFIGRPYLYGLFAAGEMGSRRVLQMISDEFKNVMHLTGARINSELDHSYIQREDYYRQILN